MNETIKIDVNAAANKFCAGMAYLSLTGKSSANDDDFRVGDCMIKFSIIFSKMCLKDRHMINPAFPTKVVQPVEAAS